MDKKIEKRNKTVLEFFTRTLNTKNAPSPQKIKEQIKKRKKEGE